MKILFLCSGFNGLTQRAWLELDRLNHQVMISVSEQPEQMEQQVEVYQPDLIVSPYLKAKIPASIWQQYTCLIVHPGIPGDRGASSLDWAILNDTERWGVTILQAVEKMDAGPVWSYRLFDRPQVSKACLYRHEVTQAAAEALIEAVQRFESSEYTPVNADQLGLTELGIYRKKLEKDKVPVDWTLPATALLKKCLSADSAPGLLVDLNQQSYFAYGGHLEEQLKGQAGTILARKAEAICVACGEHALWFTHLKSLDANAIKLPASKVLKDQLDQVPHLPSDPFEQAQKVTYQDIQCNIEGDIAFLHFDFYNGAMGTSQCRRLLATIQAAKTRAVRMLVLMGGHDLWSNGIDLNVIEAAEDPAKAAWENINAIDDLIREIILSTDHYMLNALQGNAGAGGVAFALSGDKVMARKGIVLNPHTQNMGLYGSEYWTYLLPKRIGKEKAEKFTTACLPWGTTIAKEIGLIDECFGHTAASFRRGVYQVAKGIRALPYFEKLIRAKQLQRQKDERIKPLESYREEELKRMWANFFENDQGFHEKRYRFVHKLPPENLEHLSRDWYSSRREIYRKRKWESIAYQKQS
ncbi:MAG: enoyl-CoA hydratase-related protein [Bacteroidota bacterium]